MPETSIIAVNPERTRWRWGIFILIALFVIELTGLYLKFPLIPKSWLMDDLAQREPSETIAQIIKSERDVRLQQPGELLWEEISSGEKPKGKEVALPEGSSILTLEGGRSEIVFVDGTGLLLSENTLVEIRRTPQSGLVLKLKRGKIVQRPGEGSKQSAVSIELGGKIWKPEGRTAFVAETATENTVAPTITVTEGKVRSDQSKDPALATGETATWDASKPQTSEITRKAFSLQGPSEDAVIQLEPNGSFVMRWQVEPSMGVHTAMRVDVSTDPQFKDTSGKWAEVVVPLAEPPLRKI